VSRTLVAAERTLLPRTAASTQTLQAGLPVVLAAACVRPHPLTYNIYIFLRIAENVLNHSGLDAGLVDVLSLKCLPGRAKISHHDLHHYYSNYGTNAKNYGENFWLWDWAFGTLSMRRPDLKAS
jgi:sterol desaturase/sphingolipid hydroxylase (fatty acid hydroxylase superfamily)